MIWAGHVAGMGERMNSYSLLLEKPEGKRPLGRPRHKWVDNIKMNLREIDWEGVDWFVVAQHRGQWRALANTVLNFGVP
jgi:hypothetical protein